jgi:FMN reductase
MRSTGCSFSRSAIRPYLTNKVVGLVSVAGGVQGLQAVNTMEFIVRALRGWAVPLVNPIPQAWKVFDEEGQARDERVDVQLRGLGMEVVRAARQFATHGTCDYAIPGDPASSPGAAADTVIE